MAITFNFMLNVSKYDINVILNLVFSVLYGLPHVVKTRKLLLLVLGFVMETYNFYLTPHPFLHEDFDMAS